MARRYMRKSHRNPPGGGDTAKSPRPGDTRRRRDTTPAPSLRFWRPSDIRRWPRRRNRPAPPRRPRARRRLAHAASPPEYGSTVVRSARSAGPSACRAQNRLPSSSRSLTPLAARSRGTGGGVAGTDGGLEPGLPGPVHGSLGGRRSGSLSLLETGGPPMVLTLRVGAHDCLLLACPTRDMVRNPPPRSGGLVLPGPSAGQQDPCPAQEDHRSRAHHPVARARSPPSSREHQRSSSLTLTGRSPCRSPGALACPTRHRCKSHASRSRPRAQTERRAHRTVSIRQGDNHLQKTSEDGLLCAVEEGRGTRQCGPDAQASPTGGTRAPRSGPASSDVPVARPSPHPDAAGRGCLHLPDARHHGLSTSCTSADSPRPREEADAGQETKKAACVHEDNAPSCAPYGTDVQGCRSKLTIPSDERCLSY